MSATKVSRGDAGRARVIRAAIEAIAESGPDRVTMRQIASLAGMSPGHVTYYFSSRDRVLIESLRWSEQELAESRVVTLAKARTPWSRVVRFVDLYLPSESGDLRWNLWNQVQANPPRDPESLALLAALLGGWEDDLATTIRTGVDEGAFSTPADPRSLANVTRILLDGVASEITLTLPGRTPAWGRKLVTNELRRQLIP